MAKPNVSVSFSFLLLLDRILSRYDFSLQLPTLFSFPCHAHTHDTAQGHLHLNMAKMTIPTISRPGLSLDLAL